MIILLYGKDTYRSREKLEEIIAGYRKKYGSGLNLKFLGEECSFSELCDEERQFSMFQEKRLLVVRGFANTGLKKDFLQNPEKIFGTNNIIVFYEEKEIPQTDELFLLFLQKEKQLSLKEMMRQEFRPLSGKKLFLWIKKEFSKNGVLPEEDVVIMLAELGGENLWKIKNEIEKLSAFAGYSGKLEKEKAKLLIKESIDTDIFYTIDALAAKEKRKALLLLDKHLQKGDAPLYLLSMFSYQFRNLLIVRKLMDKKNSYKEIQEKSGLSSFVLRKTHKQAEKFNYAELSRIHNRLFETDLKIKTGEIDPVFGLYFFCLKLNGGSYPTPLN